MFLMLMLIIQVTGWSPQTPAFAASWKAAAQESPAEYNLALTAVGSDHVGRLATTDTFLCLVLQPTEHT